MLVEGHVLFHIFFSVFSCDKVVLAFSVSVYCTPGHPVCL